MRLADGWARINLDSYTAAISGQKIAIFWMESRGLLFCKN